MRQVLVVTWMMALFLTGTANAAVLDITGASASSFEPESAGVKYEPKYVKDGRRSTVWVEGEDGSGLGSWVQVDLDSARTVVGFRLWNGNWYTRDFWERHNRAKEIEVELSDGTRHQFTLRDEMVIEELRFDNPVTTSSLRIRIKSVFGGTTFNDTCISEIQVFDNSPKETLLIARSEASSVYPADTGGRYDTDMMNDGLLDTMWCESNEGTGVGEWVEFDFGGSRGLSQLVLVNGNAYSFSISMKSNRAKSATLTYSDGTSQDITLRPSMIEQVIELGSHTTSSVRLTFTDVVTGSEFNDLCVSEIAFR